MKTNEYRPFPTVPRGTDPPDVCEFLEYVSRFTFYRGFYFNGFVMSGMTLNVKGQSVGYSSQVFVLRHMDYLSVDLTQRPRCASHGSLMKACIKRQTFPKLFSRANAAVFCSHSKPELNASCPSPCRQNAFHIFRISSPVGWLIGWWQPRAHGTTAHGTAKCRCSVRHKARRYQGNP